jgi:hypothetical protein
VDVTYKDQKAVFDVNFLSNWVAWQYINRLGAHILTVIVFAVILIVYEVRKGQFAPLVLGVTFVTVLGLLIWNAFRRARNLQRWREAPIPGPRQEPTLYAPKTVPLTGLHASPQDRW